LKAAVERLRQADPTLNPGSVHIEMGYLFAGTPASWLRPDVSLTHPGQPSDRFYLGAPLIAFEIVSDSDTAPQLDEKVSEYFANGAAEVWLIYPNRRHAWVYASPGAARNETNSLHTPLLPGIEIPFSEIF
jgi:Uma2 family endonuclease